MSHLWLYIHINMVREFFNNKKLTVFLLIVIVLFGAILRLWQLGNEPPSLDWDEVALGYDAYSIYETGKDEFGAVYPVVLRSFDDYKPALYSYLIIPSYKVLGLNAFSVRLPSALFGIATLISVFFLSKILFKRNDISLLTTFILAISPWHIQFSRIAFESNVGLALNVFAATFFLYSFKRPWLLTLAALSAGLSLHVYQSEKVFTPLFMLGLSFIYIKPLLRIPKKYLLLALTVGFLVVLPLIIYISQDKNALLRAKGTSIFNDNAALLSQNARLNEYNIKTNNSLGKVLDNRRIVYAKSIISGYLSHYDPNWLLSGDIARHHAPEMGLIYIWEFPFILIGIYSLVFSKFDKRAKYFIFFWFLLAPIPASITTGVPHAVRTLNFLPTWQIFTTLGLLSSFLFLKTLAIKKVYKGAVIFLVSFFVIFNFVYYLNQYFVQQRYFHAKEWIYGYEQMIAEVMKKEGNFKTVVISDKEPMDKSYMFYLFFSMYPPDKYQNSKSPSGNFETHQKFGKFQFRPINWEVDSGLKNTLFIGNPQEIGKSDVVFTVYYPDGTPAMVMAER